MISMGVVLLSLGLAALLAGLVGGLIVGAIAWLGGLWTSAALLGLMGLGAAGGGLTQALAAQRVEAGLRPTWGPQTRAQVLLEVEPFVALPSGHIPVAKLRIEGGASAPVDLAELRLEVVELEGGLWGAQREGARLAHPTEASLRLSLGPQRLQRGAEAGLARLVAADGLKFSVPLLGTYRPRLEGLRLRALAPAGLEVQGQLSGLPMGLSGPLLATGRMVMVEEGEALGLVVEAARVGERPLPRLAMGALNAALAEVLRPDELGLPGRGWRFEQVECDGQGGLRMDLRGVVGPGPLGGQP